MNPATTDWEFEYSNKTVLWEDHCEKRWSIARQMLQAGHHLVMIRPLGKEYLHDRVFTGLLTPITNVATLNRHVGKGKTYNDCNYGVVTGQMRCVVLDLDNKRGDKTGEQFLAELAARHDFEIEPGTIVKTPSGGKHLYYGHHDVEIRSCTPWKEGNIDVRSSNGDSASSHVVGPGCATPAGTYELDRTHAIRTTALLNDIRVPEPLIEQIKANTGNIRHILPGGTVPLPGSGRGSELVGTGDEYVTSPEDAQKMLDAFPCQDAGYDEWLHVGMALHYWDSSETGFEMWKEWSAKDPDRYDYKECEKKWAGFGTKKYTQPITIATLASYAIKSGNFKPNNLQRQLSMLETMNEEYPILFAGGDTKFVQMSLGGNLAFLSKSAAKDKCSNRMVMVNGKLKNPIDLYLLWEGRKHYESLGFYPPGGPECPSDVLNTWKGFATEPVEGNVSRYMELFEQMFTEDTREWVHDWFAHLIQHTGEKIASCLVMLGPEGTGKNTLLDVFRAMFRQGNTQQFVDTEQFVSNFNMYLANSALVLVNEAVWSGNHKNSAKLKGYISEEWMRAEEKNIPGVNVRNCARFVIMTNEGWAVPASRDARRYCVCHVPKVKEVGGEWWRETRKILRNPATISAVMHWYKNREITSDLHDVPKTRALEVQKQRTHMRRISAFDQEHANVLHRILVAGTATKYRRGLSKTKEPYEGHLISSKTIMRYLAFEGKLTTVPSRHLTLFHEWVREELGLNITTGIKTKMNGTQRQCSAWPPLGIVHDALAKYEMMDPGEYDFPDDWTEEGMEW